MQIISIIEQAIALPMLIAKKHCQIFKEVNPAMILPDHTPVIGKGIATNVDNKTIFFNVDVLLEICVIFF